MAVSLTAIAFARVIAKGTHAIVVVGLDLMVREENREMVREERIVRHGFRKREKGDI